MSTRSPKLWIAVLAVALVGCVTVVVPAAPTASPIAAPTASPVPSAIQAATPVPLPDASPSPLAQIELPTIEPTARDTAAPTSRDFAAVTDFGSIASVQATLALQGFDFVQAGSAYALANDGPTHRAVAIFGDPAIRVVFAGTVNRGDAAALDRYVYPIGVFLGSQLLLGDVETWFRGVAAQMSKGHKVKSTQVLGQVSLAADWDPSAPIATITIAVRGHEND